MAQRFLAEHVGNLLAQLAWTEWFDDEEPGAEVADLAAALGAALEQQRARLEARSLELRCEVEAPAWVACSAARAAVLARCLNAVVLDLPPGPLSLRIAAAGLQLRHPALDERVDRRFAAAVAARLIHHAGARLRAQPGTWTIEVEDEDAATHA